MYRVVTEGDCLQGVRNLDKGPWLRLKSEAEEWANILVSIGYKAYVEAKGDAVLTEIKGHSL